MAARASETPESEELRAAILALPAEERAPAVLQAIVTQVAEVLAVEPETIGVDDPISDLGIDSVMAVEFAAKARKRLNVQMSMFQFTGDLTLRSIAAKATNMLTEG
jgi:acyl carrier protein